MAGHALRAPDQTHTLVIGLPFRPLARSGAMRLQIGSVNHDGLLLAALGGQSLHHHRGYTHVTPPLPTVGERLWRTITKWHITPAQAIAIDEYYSAQDRPVIHTRPAMALRKDRLKKHQLRVRQPEKVAHHHPRKSGALNHAGRTTSGRSMGSDPRGQKRLQIQGQLRWQVTPYRGHLRFWHSTGHTIS